jgi:DNA-binding transcriptional LysR family regulator
MNTIDLNQILVFIKVVETGSFTKAAELLKQPKSRISRRLAALEKSLGTQLIYRTTRQMQLTENGKDYFHRCAPLIQDLENANNAMTTHSEEISGILRITAPEDYGKFIMAPLIDEFIKKHEGQSRNNSLRSLFRSCARVHRHRGSHRPSQRCLDEIQTRLQHVFHSCSEPIIS